MSYNRKIVIIGGGPAGVGFAIALQKLGIVDFTILEKEKIGSSFANWPTSTRFVTPSFTTNGFGYPDLNAISPETSPAFTLGKERLSGHDYQTYLKLLQDHYELPIKENTEIKQVQQLNDGYKITAVNGETWFASYVVIATGEFSFPNKNSFSGSEYTIGYENSEDLTHLKGEQTVLGGNESGIDLAIQLIQLGHQVSLYTNTTGLYSNSSDPSIRLSPYTRERLLSVPNVDKQLRLFENHSITAVQKVTNGYTLHFQTQAPIFCTNKPFRALGFDIRNNPLLMNLFKFTDQQIALSTNDESTIMPNVFLVGPAVKHQNNIFCYIYKFRQRFMVIAAEIARREQLSIPEEQLANYQENQMFLENCSSACVDCSC